MANYSSPYIADTKSKNLSQYQKNYGGKMNYAPELFESQKPLAGPGPTPDYAANVGSNPTMNNTPANQNIVPAPTAPLSDNYDAARMVASMAPKPSYASSYNGKAYAGYDDQGNPIYADGVQGGVLTGAEKPGIYSSDSMPSSNSGTSQMESAIKSMQDAIKAQYDIQREQARQTSGMNQSTIRGNLGRLFGANADSSEATPVVNENNRLGNELKAINTAEMKDSAAQSMSALNKLQEELASQRTAQRQAQQDAFNNAVAMAGLTGSFNGAPTLAALSKKSEEESKAIQNAVAIAGLTGQFNGVPTLDALSKISGIESTRLRDALAAAGITGTYNGQKTFDAAIKEAGLTGMYNGNTTIAGQDLLLKEAGITGMYDGAPTLDAVLKQAGLTGYLGDKPTLAREIFTNDAQMKQLGYNLDVSKFNENVRQFGLDYALKNQQYNLDVTKELNAQQKLDFERSAKMVELGVANNSILNRYLKPEDIMAGGVYISPTSKKATSLAENIANAINTATNMKGNTSYQCVQFVRSILPDLPNGLFTLADKVNTLVNSKNSIEAPQPGAAVILDWKPADMKGQNVSSNQYPGHIAYVKSVDPVKRQFTVVDYNGAGGSFNLGEKTISMDNPAVKGYWMSPNVKSGSVNGKTLPTSTVTMLSDAKQFPELLNNLESTIKDSGASFGPVMGNVRSLLPWDSTQQLAGAQLRTAAQMIGKFMEGGVLRKEDEIKYQAMLPQAGDTQDVALGKLNLIRTMLSNKEQQYKKDLSASGYAVPNTSAVNVSSSGVGDITDLQNSGLYDYFNSLGY